MLAYVLFFAKANFALKNLYLVQQEVPTAKVWHKLQAAVNDAYFRSGPEQRPERQRLR